ARSVLTLANSGLPYPVHAHAGGCAFLDLSGVPLGLFSDSEYQERTLELRAGDVIVFYTDGVMERRNAAGEEFGLRRLADVVSAARALDPRGVVRAIEQALEEHSGGAPAHDDQTILVLKRSSDSGH